MEQLEKVHLKEELASLRREFAINLFKDFKIHTLSKRMEVWHTLSWEEFRKEILKTGETFSYIKNSIWKNYFELQKRKINTINKQLRNFTMHIDR